MIWKRVVSGTLRLHFVTVTTAPSRFVRDVVLTRCRVNLGMTGHDATVVSIPTLLRQDIFTPSGLTAYRSTTSLPKTLGASSRKALTPIPIPIPTSNALIMPPAQILWPRMMRPLVATSDFLSGGTERVSLQTVG